MKNYKILLLLIFAFISVNASSQVLISLLLGDKLNSDDVDFGLEGGANFSHISKLETKKYLPDWNLGFYFAIRLKNNWFLSTGVLVKARLGAAKLTDNDLMILGVPKLDSLGAVEGDYNQKINYFNVPIMMRYKLDNGFYVEGGVQPSLRYKAWVEYVEKEKNVKEVLIKHYNKHAINPIDMGVIGGIGYRFKKRTGWTLGFKYYYGFTNVYKAIKGSKNSSFYLKANVPIGAGEQAQKKRIEKAKKRAEKRAAAAKKKAAEKDAEKQK